MHGSEWEVWKVISPSTLTQIVIPQAVYDETTGSGFSGTQFVLQAIASGWLQVRPVATKRVYHS